LNTDRRRWRARRERCRHIGRQSQGKLQSEIGDRAINALQKLARGGVVPVVGVGTRRLIHHQIGEETSARQNGTTVLQGSGSGRSALDSSTEGHSKGQQAHIPSDHIGVGVLSCSSQGLHLRLGAVVGNTNNTATARLLVHQLLLHRQCLPANTRLGRNVVDKAAGKAVVAIRVALEHIASA